MATVTRSKRIGGRKVTKGAVSTDVVLPREPREPVDDVWRYSYLLTGRKKIGKTTFAAREGALILQFDTPQIAIPVMELWVENWAQYQSAERQLVTLGKKARFPYSCVVVDGVDTWFRQVQLYTCALKGVNHPSEGSWGSVWDALRAEFTRAVDTLLGLPCGKIFICHSAMKEIETDDGSTIEVPIPKLTGQAEEVLNGKVDGWAGYEYAGRDRILVIQGDEYAEYGHRVDGHFLTPDGEPIREIPMGDSAEEARQNFVEAFHNRQRSPVASRASRSKIDRPRKKGVVDDEAVVVRKSRKRKK